jgi:hypothetical protein
MIKGHKSATRFSVSDETLESGNKNPSLTTFIANDTAVNNKSRIDDISNGKTNITLSYQYKQVVKYKRSVCILFHPQLPSMDQHHVFFQLRYKLQWLLLYQYQLYNHPFHMIVLYLSYLLGVTITMFTGSHNGFACVLIMISITIVNSADNSRHQTNESNNETLESGKFL